MQDDSLDKLNYRQRGRKINGSLVKGLVKDAATKISVGSIPSKFETIIYKTNNAKAFNCSTNRFFGLEEDNPGPGHYNKLVQEVLIPSQEVSSFSKKGLGNGFISNEKRHPFDSKYVNMGPGPGSYNNEKPKQENKNNKGSSMFLTKTRQSKSQQNVSRVHIENPGPGEYNPKPTIKNDNTYQSAFISQSNREKYMMINKDIPAVGAYNIKKDLKEKKPYKHRGLMSSFSNPTEKRQTKNHMKELVKYLDDDKKKIALTDHVPIYEEQNEHSPGPGHYAPKLADFKPEYLEAQQTSNFREGLKDRFGQFIDPAHNKEAGPGPQQYKREQFGFDKHKQEKALVSGSAFMSESNRVPYGALETKLGPNVHTIPYHIPKKKSFHLNLARKWV